MDKSLICRRCEKVFSKILGLEARQQACPYCKQPWGTAELGDIASPPPIRGPVQQDAPADDDKEPIPVQPSEPEPKIRPKRRRFADPPAYSSGGYESPPLGQTLGIVSVAFAIAGFLFLFAPAPVWSIALPVSGAALTFGLISFLAPQTTAGRLMAILGCLGGGLVAWISGTAISQLGEAVTFW